jgi:hypothetical protein
MPVNKVKKYLKNLDKETTQFLRSRDIANETERTYKNSKSNAVTPAAQAGAKRVGKELKIDLKKERNAKGSQLGPGGDRLGKTSVRRNFVSPLCLFDQQSRL